MPIQIKRGFRDLLHAANAAVEEMPPAAVAEALKQPGTAAIDVRDRHELERSGTLPGAHHASRGMLEFYADPASPMHRPVFAEAERLILYCGSSGRSALAADTLRQMGFDNVKHMAGGLKGWTEAGLPLEPFRPDDG